MCSMSQLYCSSLDVFSSARNDENRLKFVCEDKSRMGDDVFDVPFSVFQLQQPISSIPTLANDCVRRPNSSKPTFSISSILLLVVPWSISGVKRYR